MTTNIRRHRRIIGITTCGGVLNLTASQFCVIKTANSGRGRSNISNLSMLCMNIPVLDDYVRRCRITSMNATWQRRRGVAGDVLRGVLNRMASRFLLSLARLAECAFVRLPRRNFAGVYYYYTSDCF